MTYSNRTSFFLEITLKAFKKQILCFQLIKEVSIQHEYGIVKDVTKRGAYDQQFPAMLIWPRAQKKGPEHRRNSLKSRKRRLLSMLYIF